MNKPIPDHANNFTGERNQDTRKFILNRILLRFDGELPEATQPDMLLTVAKPQRQRGCLYGMTVTLTLLNFLI